MRPRLHTTLPLLLAALAVGPLAACSSTPEKQSAPPEPGVAAMVTSMLDTAELRTSLNTMRVVIVETEEVSADATYASKVLARETELASVAQALEQELVVAFSRRVHVLAVQLAPEGEEPDSEADVLAAVKGAGGTHAVLGFFQRRDDELVITLRLIDARTNLIVAAERLTLPFTHFSDVGRLAFEAGRDPLAPLGENALAAVGLAALSGGGSGALEPVVLTQGAGTPSAPDGQLLRFPPKETAPDGLAYGADTTDLGRSTSLEYGATGAPIGGGDGGGAAEPAAEMASLVTEEAPQAGPVAGPADPSANAKAKDPVVRFQKSKVLKRRDSTGGPAAKRLGALGRSIEPE